MKAHTVFEAQVYAGDRVVLPYRHGHLALTDLRLTATDRGTYLTCLVPPGFDPPVIERADEPF